MKDPVSVSEIHDRELRQPSHKDKVLTALSFMVLGFALAVITLLTYWVFQPDKIITPQGEAVNVVDEKAYAGKTVTVHLSYCKEINTPFQFTRVFLTESIEINNPTLTDVTGKGCVKNRVVEVPVPAQATSGTYRIKYHLVAQVNPIKTVTEDYYSQEIEVVGLEDQEAKN